MPIDVVQEHGGIAEVVIDHPPVNALDVAGWFALADALIAAGPGPDNRVVILRAEGRGFCAGVDIKEIQRRGRRGADRRQPRLLRRLRRRLRVRGAGHRRRPRILPRRRHRPGRQRRHRGRLRRRHLRAARGGPRGARCGHPPVAAGAPAPDALDGLHGQAGHGRRAATLRLGARGGAPGPAASPRLRVAGDIAAKSPTIIRRAKESLNGIDPVDVKRSYRFEQGFTYELHVRRRGRRAAGRLRREARRRHLRSERA